MKICLISDIHCEFYDRTELLEMIPSEGYDILLLLGDISEDAGFIQRICQKITDKPIIYVLGNHEFYGNAFSGMPVIEASYHDLENIYDNLTVFSSKFNYVQAGGYVFFGGTNWPNIPVNDQFGISRCIHDFRTGNVSIDESVYSKIELDNNMDAYFNLVYDVNKTYIGLSHFIPGEFACAEHWKGNSLNCYFVSPIRFNIIEKCDYWLFGHGHDPINTIVEGCNFISNPLGYPHEGNNEWKPLIMEI